MAEKLEPTVELEPREKMAVEAAVVMTLRSWIAFGMSKVTPPTPQRSIMAQSNGVWAYGRVREVLKTIPEDDDAWAKDAATAEVEVIWREIMGWKPDAKASAVN